MNVTRKMLGAAHDVLLKRGLMLSGEMLEEIYLAMDALANHAETSGSLPSTPAAERRLKNPADRMVCGSCGATTDIEYIPNAAERIAELKRINSELAAASIVPTGKMIVERAVMEQALEALGLTHPRFGIGTVKYTEAITALRAALENTNAR